ncbi:ATP-dependent zinc metalloprotease FtsH [Candidatus Endomicrobiellum devescovinae]|jgi:cell division protease FtsH|uniref:ATP-dependent zinc metalloprotease FtsH n=1 Tax=Candidatus Endomicrobiellum devescovinae TaxID=3242322 RepID=UPI00282476E1|nr:ATP-dependent zinc metalloprotease FtsH [Endomicrobium sp.]MDR2817875.1 ATP-dependent zinc metalloprotease FtsH [Endomicrobium sp.]
MKKKSPWHILFWITLFIIIFMLMNSAGKKGLETDLEYSQFKQYIRAGSVSKVVVGQDFIKGQFRDSDGVLKNFRTIPMNDPNLIKDMEENKVLEFSSVEKGGWLSSLLVGCLPMILFLFVWFFLMRGMMMGSGKHAMSFGKTKAKLAGNNAAKKVTFKDVAGCNEAKEELQEIIEFLKDPAKFQKLGGKIPKGVLLFGSPGTGKTLLAKAVAGEAGVPFFSSSGSEFVEMFVGVGASRVRDLFDQGRKSAPCLLFIDEIDAVGRHRFAGIGGGHDEREQTLNQLLVEMDGFDTKEGVILIAATNRPDVLDPALLRPGRFDRQVIVPSPDLKDREEILAVHAQKIKLDSDVNLNVIARRTPGFVGADLANLINEAALLAARNNQKAVNMKNMEEAIDRILAGPQRKSRMMSEKEKKIIAYHEAGHTIVAKLLPTADPVHKVSIVPRGPALGYTLQLPEEDKYLTSKSELLDRLAILFGGRVAEEVMFSEITTGAQNDISKATEIATRMVMEFGMSEKVGPMALQRPNEEVFLGRDISREVRHSGKTSELIDEEIKKIIDGAKSKATKLIKDNSAVLDKLVKYLLERENLNGEEVDKIIKGEELPPVAEKVPVTEEDRKEASVEKEVIKEKIDGGQQKSEKI